MKIDYDEILQRFCKRYYGEFHGNMLFNNRDMTDFGMFVVEQIGIKEIRERLVRK